MRQIIIIILLLARLGVSSQTLEHEYLYGARYHKISDSEEVYSSPALAGVKIYTSSHVLIKTIKMNVHDSNYIDFQPYYVSRKLFNTDDKIELILIAHLNKSPSTTITYIVDEDSKIIFSDTAGNVDIFNSINGKAKMILGNKVYSLSGVLTHKKEAVREENLYTPYPNPTQQYIMLKVENNTQNLVPITILNYSGQIIDTILTQSDFKYDASALPEGIYFYSINGKFAGKFVKN